MAVATILVSTQFQAYISLFAGLLLALTTFAGSAGLTRLASGHGAAVTVGIQLGGFILRLTLVAAALFASARLLHLQPLPLAIGLTGGFTALAAMAAVLEWRNHRIPRVRH